jgi:hypothetical protein
MSGVASFAAAGRPQRAASEADRYLELIEGYASGDPEAALRRLEAYDVSALDELLRNRIVQTVQNDRSQPLTERQLMAGALLHGEAALRAPAESGARLIRVHLRSGFSFVLRLHSLGEAEVSRLWFVAACQPLINDLPVDALQLLLKGQKLFPLDSRIAVAIGTALENLASRLSDRNQAPVAGLCGPGETPACLTAAERTYQDVLRREPRHAEARLRLGRVGQLLGRSRAAAELRQVRASGSEPHATLATLFLAQAAAAGGRGAAARDLYRSAASPGAEYVAALGASAVHEQEGHVGAAVETLLPLLLAPSADDDVWLRYRTGRLDGTIPTLRQLRATLGPR